MGAAIKSRAELGVVHLNDRTLQVPIGHKIVGRRWLTVTIGIIALIGLGASLFSRALLNMGYMRLARGKPGQAEFWFGQASRIDENLSTAWRGRGEALAAQGRVKEALLAYDVALTLQPSFSLVRWDRANARQAIGDQAGAMGDWRAIGSAQLVLRLGHQTWTTRHDAAAALPYYQLAVDLSPNDWAGYYYLAAALRQVMPARLEEAQHWLQNGLLVSPDNAEILFLSGQNQYELARYEQAIQNFTRYTQLRPNDFLGWYWRGLGWKAKGDYGRALADLEKASALDQADPNPHFQLAQIYEQIGNREAALTEFQIVLKLLPGHIESQQAVDRLKRAP